MIDTHPPVVFAIDPGPTESAFVAWDGARVTACGIEPNRDIRERCRVNGLNRERGAEIVLVIEQMECFGKPVGQECFTTVFWAGRFAEAWAGRFHLLPRRQVKLHLCEDSRVKDASVRQALIDRLGKPGTKKSPGVTYGITTHLWSALALAVVWWDRTQGGDATVYEFSERDGGQAGG